MRPVAARDLKRAAFGDTAQTPSQACRGPQTSAHRHPPPRGIAGNDLASPTPSHPDGTDIGVVKTAGIDAGAGKQAARLRTGIDSFNRLAIISIILQVTIAK